MNYTLFRLFCTAFILCGNQLLYADQLDMVKQIFSPESSAKKPEKFDQKTLIERSILLAGEKKQALEEQIVFYESALAKKTTALMQTKASLKNNTTATVKFLNKMLAELSRTYQDILKIVQELRKDINMIDESRIDLNNYLDDIDFTAVLLPEKATIDFDDLKKSAKALLLAQEGFDALEELKTTAVYDYEKRKKTLDSLEKEYHIKKEYQHNFAQGGLEVDESIASFTRKQQGEIIDEQLEQADYKKQHAQLRLEDVELRLSLLPPRILIKKMQVEALKKQYANIKRMVGIDKAYVKNAEDLLEKHRQEFFDKRERLNDNIRILLPLKEQFKKNFERVVKRFDVSVHDVSILKEWCKESDILKTENDWLAAGILGAIHAHENLVETQIDLLEAQIRQAQVNFHHEELDLEILRSWYRMTHRHAHFNVDEEISQEIKKYETERSQLKIDLTELSERRDATVSLLYKLNVVRDKIKTFIGTLEKQRSVLFVNSPKDFQEAYEGFVRADDEVRKRINFIGKLMEVYAKTIARVSEDIKEIDDLMVELGAKGFWIRSEQSIELGDIAHFIPDIKRFLRDVKATGISYIKHVSVKKTIDKVLSTVSNVYLMLLFLLRLLIVIVVYVVVRLYIPDIHAYLLSRQGRYQFTNMVRAFFAALLGFLQIHFTHIYIWLLLFLMAHFDWMDHYLAIWFYLLSIPYLLLLFYGFFHYLLQVNSNRGYVFISQNYLWRFTVVVSTLVSATICIIFFRQAFLMGNYYDSPTPDILLAINFIVLQIALMCLMGKEEILSLFSMVKTPFTEWIEERVEKYYYFVFLFLMTIIIMSNPYVGYWRQVFYVLSRLFLTVCLIPLFSWLHNRIKRSSSDFFFYYTDGSAVKERFVAGKTWYGLFIVLWFVIFVFLGIIVGSRIWGLDISLFDIKQWFNYTIYSPGLDELTGKPIHVTGVSLLKIFLYVMGGFALAYIINRFVLQRIFDPLLVGSGVQSTILTITRYVTVVMALLLGLQSAGLQGMALKLVVLVGVMSFAVKEPLADFFAYFIILVQRPVKIGDFIQIENEENIRGIVRHITPRSTIVRNRNSVTLIIPNSVIITRMVRNWSYVRTFSAIDDIEFTVAFTTDVDAFKALMLHIFDSNHNILKNPPPIVWLVDITEFGYRFRLRGFLSVDKVAERFEIESQLRMEIVRRLKQEGIEFALPLRLVKQVKEFPHDGGDEHGEMSEKMEV